MDYSKLRGKIKEVKGTELEFSEAIGMSRTTLSKKLNGKSQWSAPEIHKSCQVLDIPFSEVESYFFKPSV